MPRYNIEFEANGTRKRLIVEGERPPTEEEANRLVLQALHEQRPPAQFGLQGGTTLPLSPFDLTRTLAGERTPQGQLVAPARGALPMAGELAGTTVAGPLGGAAGAVAGTVAERALRREPITGKELIAEGVMSLAPEMLETGVRALGRGLIRQTVGAQRLRFDEAARQARALVPEVFQPPAKSVVDQQFAAVRASGLKVDVGEIAQHVQAMPRHKFGELLSEVAGIDRTLKTGGRYANLVSQIRQGTRGGYDIGDLQTLRSELRKRGEALQPFEAKQLVRDLQDAVDDAIDTGLARGRVPRGTTPDVLHEARRGYARLRATEDVGQMVEEAITSSPDLSQASFNLRQFYDTLRKNKTKLAQQVNKALDLTPGARQRFEAGIDDISQLFKTLEFSLADVSGFRRHWVVAGLGQMLSSIMLTTAGQNLFRQAVLQGRGRLSPNTIALIANVARREAMGQQSPGETLLTQ